MGEELAVVGLGKLGLPLALVFAKAGFEVYGIDISEERIKEIESYRSRKCLEPKVTEYLQEYCSNFKLSTDYQVLKDVPIAIVITQTPSLSDGHFDISYVERVVQNIHNINKEALIVVSSNINIGSIDKLSKIHRQICYNPEFIAQGTIIRDFENPRFVLIGTYTKEDGEQVANIWRKIHNKPICLVKPVEAEIIKLSSNVSFTLGITFANMIGELCEKFHADSNKVLDIIYQDRRNYKAGLGFMGPCFPRDVNCFKATALENSIKSIYKFASLLKELNDYIVEKYIQKIKSFGKKKIGILGIAYKPNVPYVYESQPLKIARELLADGYQIYIYDSLAQENAKQVLGNVYFCPSMKECVDKTEMIFIGTKNYSDIKTDKPVINPWK